VRYTFWGRDGVAIDASADRGTTTEWLLSALPIGLREGLAAMAAGERRRFWLPTHLLYSNPWFGEGVIVADIELLSAIAGPEPPTADEMRGGLGDARTLASGVRLQTLQAGNGRERPGTHSRVTLHHIGWLVASHPFDDSRARGEATTVDVDATLPGLAQVLQQMVEGERVRCWLPTHLAYTSPDLPHGPIVAEVELLSIQRALPGASGVIEVRTNTDDAPYVIIRPDGSIVSGSGNRTFARLPPGPYRVRPGALAKYAVGVRGRPADLTLTPGGRLLVTISYLRIPQ